MSVYKCVCACVKCAELRVCANAEPSYRDKIVLAIVVVYCRVRKLSGVFELRLWFQPL